MPKAGTRKVELNGSIAWLPEEEARIMELLHDGCEIQQLLNAYKESLENIRAELAAIAERKRGTKSTLHLVSTDGRSATVTWGRDIQVDGVRAEELREQLGKAWGKVFATKTAYTLAKGYKAFMSEPQGALEPAKKVIASSFSVNERKPSVKISDVGEG